MTDKLDLIKNSDEKSIEDMELGLLLSTAFYSFTQYLNEYFEEEGIDMDGADGEEILEASEVFDIGDGRYLIVEG